MKLTQLFAGVAIATAIATSASADIFIDFDGVANEADINGFYNGGMDSSGASGPDLGVMFNGFAVVSGFGETSEPNFASNLSEVVSFDVFGGFSAISFTFGAFYDATLAIYSGLGGTGALLGSISLSANDPDGPFETASLDFGGTAYSAVLTGLYGGIGIDDLSLSTGVVPEPATWALMIGGFGLAGATLRRRRRVLAVAI